AMNVSGFLYANTTNVGIGISNPVASLDVLTSTTLLTAGTGAKFNHTIFRNNDITGIKTGIESYLATNTSSGWDIDANLYNLYISTIGNGDTSGTNTGNVYGGYFNTLGDGETFKTYGVYSIANNLDSASSSVYAGFFNSTYSGGGPSYGIYASASGDDINWAGYFDAGNVYIKNNLSLGVVSPKYVLEVRNDAKALNVSGMLYVNTTNVGIGITSPRNQLDISGTLNVTNNVTIGQILQMKRFSAGLPGGYTCGPSLNTSLASNITGLFWCNATGQWAMIIKG
ncbi:MAG: hypothetical protein AABX30_00005, partial [Nanoarchaeota archaeon]